MSIVDTILAEVKRIPPMSDAGTRIMGMLGKDTISASAVADIIAHDPPLAAQVLRVANSAAYRRKTDIESIQLAISLLGNRTVVGIVMGYCMSNVYSKPLEGYDAPRGALWRHSVASALAAQHLTQYVRKDIQPEMAYTAGLLHGIGKSILSEYLKSSISDLMENLEQSGEHDFLKAEESIVGTNHCEVGLAMARQWKLPESLCECIAHYHHPSEASEKHRPLVYVVHVADFLAMIQGIDTGVDGMSYEMDPGYDKYIFFPTPNEVEKIMLAVEKEYKKMTESFEP